MKNKLIGIAAILLTLTAVIVPVTAKETQGWQEMQYAPKEPFRHNWTGTLLGTENGIEFWELYAEQMVMMPGMCSDGIEWVKMTIMWDPSAQKGQITKFEHHGCNLLFTGWTGTIETSNSLAFNVSGLGVGTYMGCLLYVSGSFEGVYYPDVEANPFVSGTSVAYERATLDWCCDCEVGGELAPVNSLALLAPAIVIAIAAITIGFALSKRKLLPL